MQQTVRFYFLIQSSYLCLLFGGIKIIYVDILLNGVDYGFLSLYFLSAVDFFLPAFKYFFQPFHLPDAFIPSNYLAFLTLLSV